MKRSEMKGNKMHIKIREEKGIAGIDIAISVIIITIFIVVVTSIVMMNKF